jgi:hypothetical protein
VVGTGNWGTVDAGGGDYHLKRTSGSYSRNHVYHNTALSSADHYTQAAYYAGTYTGHEHQVMVRAATGAFTGYAFGNTETSGSRWNSVINKIVSGTETSLQNELDFTLGWSNGGLLKGNVSGTTLTNTYRGDAHASVTDSAISTGLNIGCTSYGVDDRTFGSIYATDGIPDGWTHKIHGIAAGGMAKIHGVPKANVAKVMGT